MVSLVVKNWSDLSPWNLPLTPILRILLVLPCFLTFLASFSVCLLSVLHWKAHFLSMDNTVGVTLALYVNSSVCFSVTVIVDLSLSFLLNYSMNSFVYLMVLSSFHLQKLWFHDFRSHLLVCSFVLLLIESYAFSFLHHVKYLMI